MIDPGLKVSVSNALGQFGWRSLGGLRYRIAKSALIGYVDCKFFHRGCVGPREPTRVLLDIRGHKGSGHLNTGALVSRRLVPVELLCAAGITWPAVLGFKRLGGKPLHREVDLVERRGDLDGCGRVAPAGNGPR